MVKVHVVQAKLDSEEISHLYSVIDRQRRSGTLDLELCMKPDEADVVVTAVRMRKRLERHLDWTLAVRVHHVSVLTTA
jgi:DNA polymerase IV